MGEQERNMDRIEAVFLLDRNMDRIEAVFLLDTIWEYSCKKENLGSFQYLILENLMLYCV